PAGEQGGEKVAVLAQGQHHTGTGGQAGGHENAGQPGALRPCGFPVQAFGGDQPVGVAALFELIPETGIGTHAIRSSSCWRFSLPCALRGSAGTNTRRSGQWPRPRAVCTAASRSASTSGPLMTAAASSCCRAGSAMTAASSTPAT